MRTSMIGILAAAAVLFAAPRHARACGGGGYGSGNGNYAGLYAAGLTVLGVAAVDTGLFIFSGASALAGHQNSRGYGVFEAAWTIPQFALGMYGTISELQRPYGNAAPVAVYTAAMAFMSAHAIWTITRNDAEEEEARQGPRVGLGATYVPVGQLSQPGLGVVGRF